MKRYYPSRITAKHLQLAVRMMVCSRMYTAMILFPYYLELCTAERNSIPSLLSRANIHPVSVLSQQQKRAITCVELSSLSCERGDVFSRRTGSLQIIKIKQNGRPKRKKAKRGSPFCASAAVTHLFML